MSFGFEFHARSRMHALRLLETHKTHAPAPVIAFVKSAIENLGPARDTTRYLRVKAHGHLCESSGSYGVSTANIEVTPIDIPD